MLEVRLLGRFEVLRDGSSLNLPTRNAQSLFAYLVLNEGKAHRREKLAGILWPDSSEENARSNLRHELWRLRKALETGGEFFFQADNLTIAFQPQNGYTLDMQGLENNLLAGNSIVGLIEALSCYKGELLPGFYDEWIVVERYRLHSLFEAKIASLIELLETEERWTEVLDWGTRWATLSQWPEPAYRAVMSAYANLGDLSNALAMYERLNQGLQKDLATKPSEQTQAIYKRLRAGWKASTRKEGGSSLMKSAPAGASPTISLLEQGSTTLPKPLTSFIGREKEIEQVKRLVSKSRLVTITGSGGVGKTRLAIQVAGKLAPQFRNGAGWVELAALSQRIPSFDDGLSNHREARSSEGTIVQLAGFELIVQAVAKALGIQEILGLPLLERLLDHLSDKQLLLVLDNCEHVIDACAAFAERLLEKCPVLVILATSREALGVSGESAWNLPSLSLPGTEQSLGVKNGNRSEAVSLFVERAGHVLHNYQLEENDAPTLARICLNLDGIPLAIELAAARMNILTLREIADRLDNRFNLLTGGRRTALPRHKTLRAAIEWSYDLLNPSEQILFRRLSVFANSFTLEAAEAVCAFEEIRREDVLTLIGRLVDKSLLYADPSLRGTELATRFRFLDSIRDFGRLKLEELVETKLLRDRHADFFVGLAETAEPEFLLQDQVHWFKLIQAEQDNLRWVIEWSLESNQTESALRVVTALLWFWFSYGSSREGRDLTVRTLTSPSAINYPDLRVQALSTAGFLQGLMGETTSARGLLKEATTILRTSNDKASLAWSLQFLGVVYSIDGEYGLANEAFQEGLDLTRDLRGEYGNNFLHFLGDIDLLNGDHSRAKQIYEESIRRLQALGSKSFLAYPLRRLGYLALAQDDLPSAWRYFLESLILNREIGDKRAIAACLIGMSALAAHLNKPLLAVRLYGAVESQLSALSIKLLHLDQAELVHLSMRLPSLVTEVNETDWATAYQEGCKLTVEQAIVLVDEMLGGEIERSMDLGKY